MGESKRLTGFLIIVPILLLALGLRLNEIQNHSLWFDEAIEFNIAARPLAEVIDADRSGTHDPPLFSLALNLWMRAGNTDLQVRLLPIFASVLATAVTFVLGRAAFSVSAGWFSALLVAVAPRSVFYGLELNQYAFVILLTVLSTLLLERYLKRPILGRLSAFLLVGIAAIFTHYELVVYLIPLVLVGTLSIVWKRTAINRRQVLAWWLASLGVLALAGMILLWTYALPQKARLAEAFAPPRFLNAPISLTAEVSQLVAQTEELTRTVLWGFEPTPWAWLTGVLLLGGTLIGLLRPGRRLALYFLGSLALAYFMSGIGFLVYWHRYVLYALPLEILLICSGILALTTGRYQRYLRPAAYVGLSLLAIVLCAELPRISGKPVPETEQFSEVMQYVQPRYQDGDAIYVYYGAVPAFRRYASDDLLKAATLQIWSRKVALEKQQAEFWKAMADRPRIWLLMSHVAGSDAAFLPDALRARCQQIDFIESVKSIGYLFECRTSQ